MSSLLNFLIVAALAVPASENRHADAVAIFSCNFDKQWDVNYDQWPDRWKRDQGADFPSYVDVRLRDDKQATAGRCLAVQLKGGSAQVSSPVASISDKFSYILEARVKASHLKYARAQIRIDFCDENLKILESAVSPWFGNMKTWTKIRVGPANIVHPDVRLAKVTLHIARGKYVDLEGEVSLDDVWLARLPRMTVFTNSSFNVYTDPKDILVTCDLSGILEQDPDIRFELLDASSRHLDDDTVQLAGRLITERLSKASDIVDASVQRPAGYAGSTQWRPPIEEYGFYRVRVSMQTARGTLKDHVISIAVVPPLQKSPHGKFGWSLAGDDIPLSFEQLNALLPRVAVSWVKLPVWYGQSEPERGDELIQFTEQLAAKDIEIVGVVDRPPADLDIGKQATEDLTIADLLSTEDPSVWLPSLDAVLTRLSLRVRWWQLGLDYDTSFSDFPHLEREIGKLHDQLFRFGQDVSLGIGWPWSKSAPTDRLATWNFQQLSATPSLTGAEIATYLELPRRPGVARWVLIDPLQRGLYDLETRTRDLVQQMLAAKIHGADGIFVTHPFDDQRGVMTDAGTPGELLLPWRTTASLLSGTHFLGSLQLPGGSENRLFETPDGEVLMVVWNERPKQEVLYLGDDIRILDVWGRAKKAPQQELRQVVEVSTLPKFVLGLNPHVAKWRMSARFSQPSIPSVFGVAHRNQIAIENSFEQGVGGTVQLAAPEGWQVSPDKIDFKLAAGETAERPFQIVLPFDANSGNAMLRADFDFAADRQYRFSIFRQLVVGQGDIELELHSRLEDDGSLIVEQRMINHAEEPVDFRCLLYAPGRRRQRMQVYRLSNSQDIKTYVYPNGRDLLGSELWLRAEELGGTRVLNHRFVVEQ